MNKMVAGFTSQFQVWSILAAAGLFVATVYLTRASRRRVTGALVAALVFTALNVVWDVAAHKAGWWWYPSRSGALLPFPVYFAQDLVWGGAFWLVGWRIERRFGARAMAAYVPLLSAIGGLRDFLIAFVTKAIWFGPGPTSRLADFGCWFTLLAVAQIIMRLVAGRSSD